MPRFEYSAYSTRDVSQVLDDQVVEAASEEAAVRELRELGYVVTEINEMRDAGSLLSMRVTAFDRVKTKDLGFFTRRLATLVRAGLPLLSSLDTTIRGTKNAKLKSAATRVLDEMQQGVKLSDAMSQHPKVFDTLYISLVRAGEESSLPPALERLATMLEQQAVLKREVRTAMVYPLAVISAAVLISIAMMLFVVPAFQGIFESVGGDLPLPTKVLVFISDTMKEYWFLVPAIPAAVFFGFKQWLKNPMGRYRWDWIKLRMPLVIGDMVTKISTAQFFRTLATLQSSGVPLLQALEVATPTCGNKAIEQWVGEQSNLIANGHTMSRAFRDGYFPYLATSFLEAAEKSGQTSEMLEKIAETFEGDVSDTVKAMKAVMEPVIMAVIGVLIGGLVIAMYMPMFSIYDQIK